MKKTLIFFITISASLLCAQQTKLNPAKQHAIQKNLARLKQTGSCPKCDLRGVNLEGFSLYKANLNKANLRGANLRNTDLKQADLRNAKLIEADLTGAFFLGDPTKIDTYPPFRFSDEMKRKTADLEKATKTNAGAAKVKAQLIELLTAGIAWAKQLGANLEGADFKNAKGLTDEMKEYAREMGAINVPQ